MKYDYSAHRIDPTSLDASAELVAERVLDLLEEAGAVEYPQLSYVETRGIDLGFADLRIVVELMPGLLLPFAFDGEQYEYRVEEFEDEIAQLVMADVVKVAEHGEELLQSVDRMRGEVLTRIGDAQHQGLPIRLLEFSLDQYECWIEPGDVRYAFVLEGLGQHLRPHRIFCTFQTADELDVEFQHILRDQRMFADARANLSANGADGTIDGIALNAIARQRPQMNVLRELMVEQSLWLHDTTALIWKSGHIRSGKGTPDQRIDWNATSVFVPGLLITNAAAQNAVGGTADQLIDHPYFDNSMIIKAITPSSGTGSIGASIELDVPVYYFSALTGSVWPQVAENIEMKADASLPDADRPRDESDNVIAFSTVRARSVASSGAPSA